MSALPKSWSRAPLKDVCSIVYGKTLPKAKFSEEGYPVYGANGIIGRYPKFLYQDEQVLISCRGAYSGKINLSPQKAFITNNSLVLELPEKSSVDKRYLYYCLHTANKTKLVTGSAQPQVTINNAKVIEVSIAPLPEQRRIVARIEEIFSRLDAGVAALHLAKAQLQRYRQSVLAAAVTGQLTQSWHAKHAKSLPTPEAHLALIAERRKQAFQLRLDAWQKKSDSGLKQPKPKIPPPVENQSGPLLPTGWVRLKIASVCDIEDGDRGKAYPKKVDFSPSGFCLFLNTGNVRPDGFRFQKNQFITKEKHFELRKGTLELGDVVFTSRGTIGNIAHFNDSVPFETMRINSGMFILRGFQAAVSAEFLACLLRSPQVRDQIAKLQSGSAQPQLPIREFREFLGAIPPLAEQNQIVAEVESRTTAIDHLEADLDRQITRSNLLRQSTLQTAFAGRLST